MANEGSNENGNRKGLGALSTPTLAVIAIVLVLVVALLLFFTINSGKLEKDKNIVAGNVSGMSLDEIQRYLDETVEASKVDTSVASVVLVDPSTNVAKWLIENPESNTKNLRATVTLEDSGEVVYESGVIKPGFFVHEAPMMVKKEHGTYPCIVTFEVIDPSSNLIIGQTATKTSILVE